MVRRTRCKPRNECTQKIICTFELRLERKIKIAAADSISADPASTKCRKLIAVRIDRGKRVMDVGELSNKTTARRVGCGRCGRQTENIALDATRLLRKRGELAREV